MSGASRSTGGTIKLERSRLRKSLKGLAEQSNIKKIEKAAVKERIKIKKEEKKQKDREEGKLTRAQSAKKYLTDKANKAYYGNFQEKYISIYGKGKSDRDAKFGTVWQQIYRVRQDYYNNDDDNTEMDEINNKLKQAGVNVKVDIAPVSAAHIKNGEITYKRNIIIPYENSESIYDLLIKGELDETTYPNDYNVGVVNGGEYIRLEKNVNDVIYYYYYTPVVIKEHVKFAKIMEYYQDKKNSNEKKKKKDEKAAEINENNKERYNIKNKFDETMKSINSVKDILHDNELLSFLPCKKISKAYCYIHPINVILYDKTIEYGLIWSKNNNVLSSTNIVYNNIIYDFFEEQDTDSLTTFKRDFSKQKEISEDKDLINLSEYNDIVEITKKYDFSQGNLYYLYNGSAYVCEPTKFDYKYKQGSFDKEEYFKTHQISDDLIKDKENITALQEKINEKITCLIEDAEINIAFNKEKISNRQFESDNLTEKNTNNSIYWISYVFIGWLKYVQDVFYAGVKTVFRSKWNNVMTGFLILIFIIILIVVGIGEGEEKKNEGPNKKPKEENKDFFAVIKSIPADMTNVYNSAMKLSSGVGNMMSNSRRTVNDIADAITGDDNSDDIDRTSDETGRGGDNFIHFDNGGSVDSKYSMKAEQIDPKINNINYDRQTIDNTTITLGIKYVSVNAGEAQMFVPDCSTSNMYFDAKCKLIEHDPDGKLVIDKDSDYEQIKINDKTK